MTERRLRSAAPLDDEPESIQGSPIGSEEYGIEDSTTVPRPPDDQDLRDRIAYLEQLILRTVPDPRASNPDRSRSELGPKEPRLSGPDPFDGKNRKALEGFLTGCETVFAGQPERYAAEHPKIYYAAGLLREDAQRWWGLQIRAKAKGLRPPCFESYENFKEELELNFGDPDRLNTVKRELLGLKQAAKTEVAPYVTRFQHLVLELGWDLDDAPVGALFYQGLHPAIKDELVRVPIPDTTTPLMRAAMAIGNRLLARAAERASAAATPTQNAPRIPWSQRTATPATPASPTTPGPPATRKAATTGKAADPAAANPRPALNAKGHVSPETIRYRMDNGLCKYCGEPGHIAANCPAKTDRGRASTVPPHMAVLQTESPEEEGNDWGAPM